MLIRRSLYLFVLLILLASCSTKKNTVVSRTYHNITARYNGYYYSNENIAEGIYKIEKNHKDNFEKILPVYIYPSNEKAKSTFPDFDKAIKKSSFCIQRHAIKDKKGEVIPSSGKWIDNNWLNIGVAQFYKREIFSSLESFEYVARTFVGSKDKYTALIWIAKVNNEIGSVSSSEQIISLLKNERNLPAKIKKELPIVQADYYMRRGQYTEASARLMEVTRSGNIFTRLPKSKRARYSFIIAQMFEAQKDYKRATQYYQKTIRLKPSYDMVFYSKIKMARILDVKRNNSEKTKKDLLKMSKEFKNSEYYDVIFYTLGEIEERERNTDKALQYYKRSVQTSVANPTQKALSFLRLGEIYFDQTNYPASGAYYDSAVVTLPKDHRDYENIVNRKKTLTRLIGYIQTISSEDSLQRLAKMDTVSLNKFIDKIIADKEAAEEKKRREAEALANAPGLPGGGSDPNSAVKDLTNPGLSFPFYNPNTTSLGIAEFTKRWGNRKYEENWRRSNKALVMEEEKPDSPQKTDTALAKTKDPVKLRQLYKKNLPFGDSALATSNKKIMDAYYFMGSLYKEELNNTQKAVASFEELNRRYPANKYLLNTYYVLYRIHQAEKRNDKAEYYKNKILAEFPESEFALLIKNPNAAEEINTKKSEAENFYTTVYRAWESNDYDKAFNLASEGISKYGKNEYRPKFEFIRAMSFGKLKGIDSLEYGLKLLVAQYPKSEVAPLANDILESIKKQKNPEVFRPGEPGGAPADTFVVNHDGEHFLIALVPDDPKIANAFKSNLEAFNQKYYSAKQFKMSSNLFGQAKQIIILKSFENAKEIMAYLDYYNNDKDLFKGDVKKELVETYPILAANLPLLYKKKNLESYKLFYLDNFKKFMPGQKQ
jgi:tetratricopeptide (TPR) repeat protein